MDNSINACIKEIHHSECYMFGQDTFGKKGNDAWLYIYTEEIRILNLCSAIKGQEIYLEITHW